MHDSSGIPIGVDSEHGRDIRISDLQKRPEIRNSQVRSIANLDDLIAALAAHAKPSRLVVSQVNIVGIQAPADIDRWHSAYRGRVSIP